MRHHVILGVDTVLGLLLVALTLLVAGSLR